MNGSKHGLRDESPLLANESPERLEETYADWNGHYRPSSPGRRALIDRVVMAGVDFERSQRYLRGTLDARRSAAAICFDQQQDDVVQHYVQLLKDDPAAAVRGLKRSAAGCRWLISEWLFLEDWLKHDGHWATSRREHVTRLMGYRPEDQKCEESYWVRHMNIMAHGKPSAEMEAKLFDPKNVPDTLHWLLELNPTRPEHALENLQKIVRKELAAFRPLEEKLRTLVEEPARAAEEDRAGMLPAEEQALWIRYERMHDSMFHRAYSALERQEAPRPEEEPGPAVHPQAGPEPELEPGPETEVQAAPDNAVDAIVRAEAVVPAPETVVAEKTSGPDAPAPPAQTASDRPGRGGVVADEGVVERQPKRAETIEPVAPAGEPAPAGVGGSEPGTIRVPLWLVLVLAAMLVGPLTQAAGGLSISTAGSVAPALHRAETVAKTSGGDGSPDHQPPRTGCARRQGRAYKNLLHFTHFHNVMRHVSQDYVYEGPAVGCDRETRAPGKHKTTPTLKRVFPMEYTSGLFFTSSYTRTSRSLGDTDAGPGPRDRFLPFAEVLDRDLGPRNVLERVLADQVILSAWALRKIAEKEFEAIDEAERASQPKVAEKTRTGLNRSPNMEAVDALDRFFAKTRKRSGAAAGREDLQVFPQGVLLFTDCLEKTLGLFRDLRAAAPFPLPAAPPVPAVEEGLADLDGDSDEDWVSRFDIDGEGDDDPYAALSNEWTVVPRGRSVEEEEIDRPEADAGAGTQEPKPNRVRSADRDVPLGGRWGDRLAFDLSVSEDSPVIRGTWVTVSEVVSLIVDGWTWTDILRNHPELTEDDIRTSLAYTVAEEEGDV